ncbi:MAG: flavocytochrome c [Oscillospiraceae bacterium]
MKRILAIGLSFVLVLSLAACGAGPASSASSPAASSAEPAGIFTPGAYEGSAAGFGGDVKVTVTLTADQIQKIDVHKNAETPEIGAVALEKLPTKIIEGQTLAVDAVAGATVSSKALVAAVTAALTASGADVTALQTPAPSSEAAKKEEALTVDVVVVGAGGAGMTAALEAKAAGKNVLIVEKMAMVGGNTSKATGGMNAAETSVQKAAGVTDTVASFVADTMKGGYDLNNKELVTALAERSAGAIDWLASIGAPLPELTTLGGASNKRAHRPEGGGAVGSYLVEKLGDNLTKAGIEVRLNTKATSVLMKDGAAVGILAESDDTKLTINAKAVVITTGGFGANEALYTSYKPELKGFVTTNAPGATGDGIVMAKEVGAKLVDMEQIQIHPTVHQATSIMITEGLRGDGAILVNQGGLRFFNEMETRDKVSAAEIAQDGSCAYLLFDQALRERVKAVESYAKNKLLLQGDTVAALAAEGISELSEIRHIDRGYADFEETLRALGASITREGAG